MSKIYSGIRGTSSLDPAETYSFNQIIKKSRNVFDVFGYEEISLPLLEEEGLFRRSVGDTTDIVEKQMFKIEGKDIVLRPEGTAQVIRYYLENSLYKKSDFYKFSYVGPMFRGERPQKGRLRQFHHIGAEAIGSNSFYLDAEIISLSMRILDIIGVREKSLNINTLGCSLDKVNFSKDLKKKLIGNKSKFCQDCQRRIQKNPLRVIDCKNKTCKSEVATLNIGESHLCSDCRQHFNDLRVLLDELGIDYTYSPHLVRGLDYYTNTVFEITSSQLGSQDAIGAGGRYNELIQCLGGPSISAIGFALGVERLMLILDKSSPRKGISVYVATVDDNLKTQALKLTQQLRGEGIRVDTGYLKKSLKGQLRYAQKKGAKFVVIMGEEEIAQNSVMLKDMDTATQEKVKIDAVVNKIKSEI
ncbi:MAG: histidine--tRNA ligase [Candidatus Omnitrophota bacterium]|nr:histidine--tRNA ligase [Candidatus Omnitrophota bacterium]